MTQESQVDIEELWRASDLKWLERRRRENCEGWIDHHRHLADTYASRAVQHEEQVVRYRKLFASMKGEAI